MNLNLEKDQSIINVLNKLSDIYGESNLRLTNYWDADLCAIGIKSSNNVGNLVYISTYQIQQNRYFVEVEDSSREVILNGYKNGELYERNFDELSEIIEKYLYLQRSYEQ